MSNAVKFQRNKGVVKVYMGIDRGVIINEELLLEIVIRDQGIGMTQEEVDHVFEPFWKSADQHSKELNP